MKEIWKWIPKWKRWYKASTFGRVKSVNRLLTRKDGKPLRVKGKILKPNISTKYGHLTVNLYRNGKYKNISVSRLILLTFKGPCPKGCEARHFPDRDPTNNRPGNLSWSDRKTNQHDKFTHGTILRGIKNGNGRLSYKKIKRIRKLHKKGEHSQRQLASIFNCSQTHINFIVNHKIRKVV